MHKSRVIGLGTYFPFLRFLCVHVHTRTHRNTYSYTHAHTCTCISCIFHSKAFFSKCKLPPLAVKYPITNAVPLHVPGEPLCTSKSLWIVSTWCAELCVPCACLVVAKRQESSEVSQENHKQIYFSYLFSRVFVAPSPFRPPPPSSIFISFSLAHRMRY